MLKHFLVALPMLAMASIVGIAGARAQDAARCQLIRIAEWPVRLSHFKIVVDGTVKGDGDAPR